MSDLKIHREHHLGLAKARKVALAWAEAAESKFDMQCTLIEGEFSDTVEFVRSGVKGRLIVAADHFDLDAKLGFLIGAFRKTIEREIESELDGLLAKGAKSMKGARSANSAKSAKGAKGAKDADDTHTAATHAAGRSSGRGGAT
jgi:putative polyhydroxyalkanoate system protein